jgi:hypothetical protein
MLGYRVIRFTYGRVVHEPSVVAATHMSLLAR